MCLAISLQVVDGAVEPHPRLAHNSSKIKNLLDITLLRKDSCVHQMFIDFTL